MNAPMLNRMAVTTIMIAVASMGIGRGEEPPNLQAETVVAAPAIAPVRDQVISKGIVEKQAEVEKLDKARPERPEVERISKNAKESVEEIKSNFRAKADDYVRRQKEIVAELKGAKGEEKSKVREKLKELKEQWKNERPDVRDVVSDLKEKVEKEKEKGKGKGGGKPRD